MNQKQMITYEEFIADLKDQLDYQLDGGTSYRIKTAELALKVAEKVDDVELFIKRETVCGLTDQLLKDYNDDRKSDVAEFLYHTAKYLFRKRI